MLYLELIEYGKTPAYKGNSTGAILTILITFPVPGVSKIQKKGLSSPLSVFNLLIFY